MIEIPESYSLSKQLNHKIKGKKIISVITNSSPHKFAFYNEDPKEYNDILKGKVINNIKSFGGYIEIEADDAIIILAEGANIRYFLENEKIPEKHQLFIKFNDCSAITVTTRMYALIHVSLAKDYIPNEYYTVAKEKPSPLSKKFTKSYFNNLILGFKPNTTLKSFLATKQRIPGLGNGTLQDILFNSKLHPKSIIKNLTIDDEERLFLSIKETLKKMSEEYGRNTEKTIYGSLGKYETILSNKTFKNPCPVCGDTINKESYLGGTIYYCPTCQVKNK